MKFFEFIQANIHFITLGLAVFCLLLFILCIVAICKASKVKKRMNKFMGTNDGSDFEEMLNGFINQSNIIDERQVKVINDIKDIKAQLRFCVQKIGVVRYNPFSDVGGELCYAVAILDENNDGFVLNSVYSRDGCYTYAKPIEAGKCEKYKLSDEEVESVRKAINREK